jgi:type IV pilus assembly protein PilA
MIQVLKNKLKNQKGFTLIELLAVIVILGILAAIAIPSINNIIQKSRMDSVKSDAIAVYNAAKLFASQHEGVKSFTGKNMQGGNEVGATPATNYTSADSVLDNTSLTGISVAVQDDGSLKLTATGTAGSITVNISGATYKDLTTDTNWSQAPTNNAITVPKASS